ncbi:MAG: GGDEF domain-containing protein [Oligoflexus sp.]
MLEKLFKQTEAKSAWDRRLRSLCCYVVPTLRITDPTWQTAWQVLEKRRFRVLARFYCVTSALAYILHFFLIDLPIGKQPISLWATYRMGLAGIALVGFLLTFPGVYQRLRWYKAPVALTGLAFGYFQALAMTWHDGIPYFYAFLIPSLTCILLRWNILNSMIYLGLAYALQWNSFLHVGLEVHLIISAVTMSSVAVIVFRANMLTDVNGFISEQLKADMQQKLNAALTETKRKEQDLAQMNTMLVRKNQVFHTLLEASTQLPHFEGLSSLLKYATQELQELFSNCGFGIIFCEQGSRRIADAAFINLSTDVQRYLMYHNSEIWRDSFESQLHKIIFSKKTAHEKHYDAATVRLLSLVGTADKIVGKALIVGLKSDQQALDTISLFLALVTSCAENMVLTKRLEHMAHMDKLTNTFNRNFFDREFKRLVRTKEQYPELDFSIFLIDVNGLKEVNDHYGHKEGDNLIVKVAGLLKSCCRKTDVVARLGGDEFVIICPETKNAHPLLERIRSKEGSMNLVCHSNDGEVVDIPVRMSIGLASTSEVTPQSLLKKADELMYHDKREFYKSKSLGARRVSSW